METNCKRVRWMGIKDEEGCEDGYGGIKDGRRPCKWVLDVCREWKGRKLKMDQVWVGEMMSGKWECIAVIRFANNEGRQPMGIGKYGP